MHVKEALHTSTGLDVLEHFRAGTLDLQAFLTTKMIICTFLARMFCDHKDIAVILHISLIILESSEVVADVNHFIHGISLHIFPGSWSEPKI